MKLITGPPGRMTRVTYFGHSCFMVETKGVKILFDPFISPNDLAKEIKLDSISCDYIFVSHGHFDHLADLEYIAKRTNAKVVGTFELHNYAGNLGITNIHAMNIGGKWDFGFCRVRMVSAIHTSSLPDGSYGGTAAGFVFQNDEVCFYFAGDTALHYDMKLIGEEYNLSFAMLPIGGNFTMDVEDAVRAAGFVGCKHVIGMHYDTFGSILVDHDAAREGFEDRDIQLTLMNIGEQRTF